jgi:hypothetical protein
MLVAVFALESDPVWCACDPQHLGECTIDLFQGPVLAPSRATGLGGSFAAYAEGVDAIASNAAAVAVRMPYSLNWFDFDLTVGVSFPATFRRTDFDNDGQVGFTYKDFLFYTLGGQVQIGPWGLGVLADFQRYDVRPVTSTGTNLQGNETLGRLHALLGRSFLGGLVSVGLGVRAVTLSIDTTQSDRQKNQLTMNGVGPEVGLLIRPDYEPWRLGATFRAQVNGRIGDSDASPNGAGMTFAQPASIALPFELELGAAIQVGPRPLNPRWLDPHEQEERVRRQIEDDRLLRQAAQEADLERLPDDGQRAARKDQLDYQENFIRREEDEQLERAREVLSLERKARYANWPRERITVLLELLVSGPAPRGAVGLESFFAAQLGNNTSMAPSVLIPSGQDISYSPRLGLEGEPVTDRLQTRIGTYIEPSRFARRLARQHFTFGFDVKLFPFSFYGLFGDQIWRIGGFADMAPRYQNFGVSIGAWH